MAALAARPELRGPTQHAAINELLGKIENTADDCDLPPVLLEASHWTLPKTDLNHWIKVLNRFDAILEETNTSYGLSAGLPQLNEYTPKTKALLLAVLQFTHALLDHATNKRVYASFERLSDLYLTCDLDVLEATLRLSLRPALMYKQRDPHAQERLLALSQGWNTKDYGLSMTDLVKEDAAIPADLLMVKFDYYRQVPLSAVAPSPETQPPSTPAAAKPVVQGEGLHTITVGHVASSSHSVMETYADAADTYKIPNNVRLSLLHKIRIAAALPSPVDRRRMLMLRLLSLAVLVSNSSESSLLAKLFILEPELVPQIANLVHPDRPVPTNLRTAALYSLEALLRVHFKQAEVMSAVNVSVNHGILLGIVRKLVADLASNTGQFDMDFVDVLFLFISALQIEPFGGTMLINAGLMPLLIELVKTAHRQSDLVVARTINTIDAMSYGYQAAMASFLTNRGMTVFVDRVKEIVDDIATRAPPADDENLNHGWLSLAEATVTKALLRAIARIMSSSGTQGEGLRNLIDSSLPFSLKSIMEHRKAFGPQIYALSLNITTTFIHNEPTHLSVLQEQGLPEVFYDSIDQHGIDATFDVLSAIPNTIGALCLNDAGREGFMKRSIIPKIFDCFTTEKHARMLYDKENATTIGAAFDELIRHHPTLKTLVLESIQTMLQKILDFGHTYVAPTKSVERLVAFSPAEAASTPATAPIDEDRDAIMNDPPPSEAQPPTDTVSGPEEAAQETTQGATSSSDASTASGSRALEERDRENLLLTFLEAAGKFMEGLLTNQGHCKEFAATDSLHLMCKILQLPSIPADFHHTTVASTVTLIFKTVGDLTPVPVLNVITAHVGQCMTRSAALWDPTYSGEARKGIRWLITPSDEGQVETANEHLRHLVSLEIMIGMVESVFPHLAFSPSRGVITAALKSINISYEPKEGTEVNLLRDLGRVQKACMRENVEIKFLYTDSAEPLLSPEEVLSSGEAAPKAPKAGVLPSSPQLGSSPPNQHNLRLLRSVLTHTTHSLEGLFSSIIGRPAPRRTPDQLHRQEAIAVAEILGHIMTDFLDSTFSEETLLVDVAFATLAIKSIATMIGNEKWSACPKASLAVCLETNGGLKRLIGYYDNFFKLAESSTESLGADPTPPLHLLQAFGGMRIALGLMEKLADHKIIDLSKTDSSAHFLNPANPEYIDVPAFMVRCRSDMFDSLQRTWTSASLKHAPPNVVRLLFRALVNILAADGESPIIYDADAAAGRSNPLGLPTMSEFLNSRLRLLDRPVSENFLRQLMDMGFGRNEARAALLSNSNNMAAATEWLLSNPDLGSIVQEADNANASEPQVSGDQAAPATSMETDEASSAAQPDNRVEAPTSTTSSDALKAVLDEKRALLKPLFVNQALGLIGTYKQLIFDLKQAGVSLYKTNAEEASSAIFKPLLERLAAHDLHGPAPIDQDQLASEFQFLALLSSDPTHRPFFSSSTDSIVDLLSTFILLLKPGPSGELALWSSSVLLTAENVFSLSDAPRETSPDDPLVKEQLLRGPSFQELRQTVFNACVACVDAKLSAEMLVSVLRVLVLLTRDPDMSHKLTDGHILVKIFSKLRDSDIAEVNQQGQELAVLLLRHAVESHEVLKNLMRYNVQDWIIKHRNRPIDIGSFLHAVKVTALRDPSLFVKVCSEEVELNRVGDVSLLDGAIVLKKKETAPSTTEMLTVPGETKPADESQKEPEVTEADPPRPISTEAQQQVDSVVHFLMRELRSMHDRGITWSARVETPVQASSDRKTDKPSVSPEYTRFSKELDRARFLIACLSELLYSYPECKRSFCRFEGDASSFFTYLLEELVPSHYLSAEKKQPSVWKNMRTGEWAILLLVSLCTEQNSTRNTSDAQETGPGAPPSVLIDVRKQLISSIAQAISKAIHSSEPTAVRYGRLCGLADLCLSLLMPPPSPNSLNRRVKPNEEYYEGIARLMVEEQLATTLTSALAEVDLNFPTVKSLINRLLKPLQCLSKVVRAQGKPPPMLPGVLDVDTPFTDSEVDSDGGSQSDRMSVQQDNGTQEELPDIYRSSALGMYEGELEGEGDIMEHQDDQDYDVDEEMDDMMELDPVVPSDESDESDIDTDDEEDDIPDDSMETGSEDDDDDDEDDDDEHHSTDGSNATDPIELDAMDPIDMVIDAAGEDEDSDSDLDDDGEDDNRVFADQSHAPPQGDLDSEDEDAYSGDDNARSRNNANNAADVLDRILSNGAQDAFQLEDDLAESDDEDQELLEGELVLDDDNVMLADDMMDGLNPVLAGAFGSVHNAQPISPRGHGTHAHREPRPLLVAGPGQAAREMAPHPLLVDNGAQPTSTGSSSRRSPRRGDAMNYILQTIGEQLGENAFQLFEQVLSSVQPANSRETQHFQLVTQDDQIAATIEVPPIHGRGRTRPYIHVPNMHGIGPAPTSSSPFSTWSALTPTQTSLRWDQENRAFQSCAPLNERLSWLIGSILKSLKPSKEALEKEALEKEALKRDRAKAEEGTQSSAPIVEEAPQQSPVSNTQGETSQPVEEAAQAMEGVSVSDPLAEMFALTQTLANDLAHLIPSQPTSSVSQQPPVSASATTQPPLVEAPISARPEIEDPMNVDVPEGPTEVVQASTVPPETQESADPQPAQRVTILIHGNTVDITDTGIDPTFLEALPEDMREEVLNQHIRETRAASRQAARASQTAPPANISPEFLNALPPEIRDEVIQQERVAQGASERSGAGTDLAGPIDMDPASFLATLDNDPELRQEVLLQTLQGGSAGLLSTFPPTLLREIEVLRGRLSRSTRGLGGHVSNTFPGSRTLAVPATKLRTPQVSREATQLLDKAGIATIVRLLFFPQQLDRGVLQSLLSNLCDHPKTRLEIVNYLLAILQDGTRDATAVDKTFSHMSAKAAKATPKIRKLTGVPDTPATPRDSSSVPLIHVPGENVPNLVAQRCLEALAKLVHHNESVARYFLLEQDSLAGLSKKSSKKAPSSVKGKEKATTAPTGILPLSILLGLLDRESLLSVGAITDSLTGLMAIIARPLLILATPPPAEPEKPTEAEVVDPTVQTAAADQQSASASQTAPEGPNTEVAPAPAIGESTRTEPTSTVSSKAPENEPVQDEKVLFEQRLRKAPPVFSPDTLRLVVNILDANEVSSKTFSNTLALMQSLSCLPNSIDVLSEELTTRAQRHGTAVLPHLEALAASLQNASQQSDVPVSIIAKFSSASSLQAKMLRVLKTIDYIHSHRIRSSGSKMSDDDKAQHEETVKNIFLTFDFDTLWMHLSSCLTSIEDKPGLSHVGTVLLPMIESLMVVSKYIVKPDRESSPGNALSPRTPTQSLGLGSNNGTLEKSEPFFFSFTRQHRKILNTMVRSNPSLMLGSFSILVHNPAVLEFENKRNYFNQQLHKRRQERHGTLQVNVRRQYVFEDSFQSLGPARRSADQLKYGKLSVRFYDEEGVDAGGVTREWYSVLARSIFNPNYVLFQPSSSDQLVYQPNPHSYVNPDHLPFFTFVGRIIGKSVYDGRLLEAYFTKAFYKHLLGLPVDLQDLESVDPDNYRSLVWMLDNPIEGVLELTFSIEADEWGVTKVVDLKENGRNIPVTDDNKREYVDLVVRHRLTESIQDQIQAFVSGFTSIVPKELVSIFNASELQLLISGMPDIDVDEWRANTDLQGYSTSSSPVIWFWRAVRSFSQEERAKLLQFVTGSSRVPLEGFGALQGVSGNTKFTITAAHKQGVLPSAHSCFNQLDMPTYNSYEELRKALLMAITETEGFGFV